MTMMMTMMMIMMMMMMILVRRVGHTLHLADLRIHTSRQCEFDMMTMMNMTTLMMILDDFV